ncbi:MAG: SPASM domain-containing protein [Helicobacter sp.]|nr:SPASM domain-containing protein [Helicobacter sp.]
MKILSISTVSNQTRGGGGSELHMHIKINGDYFSISDRERFLDIFGEYCDTIFIDGVANIWPMIDVSQSLLINLSNEDKPKESQKLRHQYGHIKIKKNNLCPNIFYQLLVHSNGDVSLCCADYLKKLVLGNIKTTRLKDIWNSEGRKNILHSHIRNNLPQICKVCEYPNMASTVDLESHRERIETIYGGIQ